MPGELDHTEAARLAGKSARPNLEAMLARAEAATPAGQCGFLGAVEHCAWPSEDERPIRNAYRLHLTDADFAFLDEARTDLPAAVRYAMELEEDLHAAHEGTLCDTSPCPICTAVRARA